MTRRGLLGAIFLGALSLRLIGINFGLPDVYHQDEPIVVNHALAYGHFDFNPHFFKIPPLLSYLLFVVYGIWFLAARFLAGYSLDRFARLYFENPTVFFLIGRIVFGAFLGSASVVALYRLGNNIFSKGAAMLAALFLAVNFLHVRDSHYCYVDIPMIFSMLMMFGSLARYSQKALRRDLGIAILWAGVAVAFKYIAAIIFLPLGVVIIETERRCHRASYTKGFLYAVGAVVACVGIYIALNPFMLIDFKTFYSELAQQAAAEGQRPLLHHWRYSLLEACGHWLLGAGALGLLIAFWREKTIRWLLFFPFAYYGMITVFSQPFERYAMPIVPFVCLGAAYLIMKLYGERSERAALKKTLATLLFLAVICPSAIKSLYLDKSLLTPDTRFLAARWIEAHVPEQSAIAMNHAFFAPRLWQSPEQILQKRDLIGQTDLRAQAKNMKLNYLASVSEKQTHYSVYYLQEQGYGKSAFMMWSPLIVPSLEEFKKNKIKFFVRYRDRNESPFFEKVLKRHARLLKTFSPYRDPEKFRSDDEWANTALAFRGKELFSRNSPGPYLEIYRLDYAQ